MNVILIWSAIILGIGAAMMSEPYVLAGVGLFCAMGLMRFHWVWCVPAAVAMNTVFVWLASAWRVAAGLPPYPEPERFVQQVMALFVLLWLGWLIGRLVRSVVKPKRRPPAKGDDLLT